MLTTIFGIALATGSILMDYTKAQDIVNNNQGIYINDIGSGTKCNQIRYVASHNFNKLGKKIALLQPGDKLFFDGCSYIVREYKLVEIRKTSYNTLKGQNGVLWLQTCADDAGKYAFIIKLEVDNKIKRRVK